MPLAYVGLAPSAHLYAGKALMDPTPVLMFGFNQPVNPATLVGNLTIRNAGVDVPGAFGTLAGGRIVTFTPTTVLNPTSWQVVDVSIGTGVLAAGGAAPSYAQGVRFGVSGTPTVEVEANDDGVPGVSMADMAAAQALAIGAGSTVVEVNGTMGAADDVDVYAVTLTAGQRLMATVLQARLVGATTDEMEIGVHDAQGRRLRMGRRRCFDDQNPGNGDPYLDWIVETSGTYYIVVNIGSGAGTPAYTLQAVVDALD